MVQFNNTSPSAAESRGWLSVFFPFILVASSFASCDLSKSSLPPHPERPPTPSATSETGQREFYPPTKGYHLPTIPPFAQGVGVAGIVAGFGGFIWALLKWDEK